MTPCAHIQHIYLATNKEYFAFSSNKNKSTTQTCFCAIKVRIPLWQNSNTFHSVIAKYRKSRGCWQNKNVCGISEKILYIMTCSFNIVIMVLIYSSLLQLINIFPLPHCTNKSYISNIRMAAFTLSYSFSTLSVLWYWSSRLLVGWLNNLLLKEGWPLWKRLEGWTAWTGLP